MKKLIEWIKAQYVKIWGASFYFLLEKGDIVVKVTNILKLIVENPKVNAGVALSSNKLDNALFIAAKVLVKNVLVKVGIALSIVKEAENPDDAFIKMLAYVRSLTDAGRSIIYTEFSGLLFEYTSKDSEEGRKLSRAERIALIQLLYKGVIK